MVHLGLPGRADFPFPAHVTSLYLHIPFCSTKCPYCSFASIPGQKDLHARYCRALGREIGSFLPAHRREPLDTLFFGGGTPSVLDDQLLLFLLDVCRDAYGFGAAAEITLESNPETLGRRDLQKLRKRGVNRLSIGIQSLNEKELQFLGRGHDAQTGYRAVRQARSAGFTNLSLDLMYGLPGQTPKGWQQTLSRTLALLPEHLSIYQLNIEEQTEFYERHRRGSLVLPEEECVLAMDAVTEELCSAAGLEHYEISNFARPGYVCRHNLVYWRNEAYLGYGAAAVSYIQGRRCRRVADPRRYCELIERGASVICEEERLEEAAVFRETVVMGLRLHQGVSEERLRQRFEATFSEIYGDRLQNLLASGLLFFDGQVLRLTPDGRRVANVVMAELV